MFSQIFLALCNLLRVIENKVISSSVFMRRSHIACMFGMCMCEIFDCCPNRIGTQRVPILHLQHFEVCLEGKNVFI